MDVLNILSGIKGKVLDAVNYELLRGAYDLQNDNIEQLKSNNDAIRESNTMLKDRIDHLESETSRLKSENADLRSRIAVASADDLEYEPSTLAKQILQLYRKIDEHLLFDKHAASVLGQSQLEIEAAFGELKKHDIVSPGIFGDRGAGYFLTDAGRQLVLSFGRD